MSRDIQLRSHLVDLLTARQAHCTFDEAVADLPPGLRGRRPEALPYSPWEQVEHLRIAQHDILDFCRNPDYTAPAWPAEYWPDAAVPPSDDAWNESVRQVQDDLHAMCELVQDPDVDLYDEIPHGDGQTYLREALLVADHNAYHIGQIVVLRRLLGAWE